LLLHCSTTKRPMPGPVGDLASLRRGGLPFADEDGVFTCEGDIANVLAAVEDFMLAQATYEAALKRWPKARVSCAGGAHRKALRPRIKSRCMLRR
jgi:hypothetical protein